MADLYAPLHQTVDELSALRGEVAVLRATVAKQSTQIQQLAQQFGGHHIGPSAKLPQQPVSEVSAWRTNLVLVVATVKGRLSPRALHTWARNTSSSTTIIYQRLDPSSPNYSPNLAFEAGVHIQFIFDYYDNLPNQTAFLQDHPDRHTPQLASWLACLRPDASYAPLVKRREIHSGVNLWHRCCRAAAVVEQCWRDSLDVFQLGWLLPDGAQANPGFYAGSMFVASAEQIRKHPRTRYARMHAMAAGGDGRCHQGPLQWERLHKKTANATGEHTLDSPGMSKHTTAGAWESLHHVLVGGLYRDDKKSIEGGTSLYAPYAFNFCTAFRGGCDASPCDTYRSWVDNQKWPQKWKDKEHHRMGKGMA